MAKSAVNRMFPVGTQIRVMGGRYEGLEGKVTKVVQPFGSEVKGSGGYWVQSDSATAYVPAYEVAAR